MKKTPVIAGLLSAAGGLFLAAGLLGACSPDTSAPVLQRRAVPRPEATAIAAADRPRAEATMPALPPFTDTACLECHTDQDRLKTLAVSEQKTEALSSGPG